MVHHFYITAPLLALAAALTLISSIGLLCMRDAFQRLHYNAPVVTLASLCIVIAVWVEDPDWQARIKVICIFLILAVMNSVLNHATARAIRIREKGHWPPEQQQEKSP